MAATELGEREGENDATQQQTAIGGSPQAGRTIFDIQRLLFFICYRKTNKVPRLEDTNHKPKFD